MKFDIKQHLQNHAYYFKQSQEISKDDLHFNFSFLDLQFLKSVQPPEKVLFELLQELKKETKYKVKNGYYIDKDGEKKQKYTKRKINLQNAIKIEAIHIEGSEGEYTMPHIHLILDKDARLGKDFSLLKTHIIEVSKKYGLKPNFAEIAPNANPASYRNLGKSVKNFSWIIRKMPNDKFKEYVETKLQDKLEKFWEYSLLSGNLQYYIKTLEFIKKRLNRQKIAFEYKNHNLRNTYPIPLTQTDLEVIDLINQKKFSQKDIKPYLQNAILRDFVRYSYFKDKSKALIINSLSKQTKLLENLRPNKKIIDNYLKLYSKTLDQDKQTQIKEQVKQKEVQSVKEILKTDLLKVAETCINEKELRQKMQELGYTDFGFKKKQGKVFAYQFKLQNEDKKIVVKCSDSISISEIRAILKENWRKTKQNKPIKSDISNKQSEITTYLLPKPTQAPKALPVPYKTQQIEDKKEKVNQKIKSLRIKRRENANNIREIERLIEIAKTNAIREWRDKKEIRQSLPRELTIKRELNEISRRKHTITNESETIRRETQSFGKRLTSAITKVATTITNTIGEIGKRLKKLIKSNNLDETQIEILKKTKLYDKFIDKVYENQPEDPDEALKWEEENKPYSDEKFIEYITENYTNEEIEETIENQKEKQSQIQSQHERGWHISR